MELISWWLSVAAVLSLLLGLSRLVRPKVGPVDQALAGALLGMGVAYGHLHALHTGHYGAAPHLLGLAAPLIAAIGPLLHWVALSTLQLRPMGAWWRWYLWPTALVAAMYLPLYVQTAEVKRRLVLGQVATDLGALNAYLAWADALLVLLLVGFLARACRLLHRRASDESAQERRARRLALSSVCLALLGTVFILSSYLTSFYKLRWVGMVVVSLYPVFLLLASERFPYWMTELRGSVQKARYPQRRIVPEQIEQLSRRLEDEVNRRHADTDLQLGSLADAIGLSAHQLSELLNLHLGLSFSRYVNRIRVRHAMSLLMEKPALAVIDVAYAVGFGSKSAFNESFKAEVGATPSQYRRDRLVGRR